MGSGNKYFYLLDVVQGTTVFECEHLSPPKPRLTVTNCNTLRMYETGDSLVASGRVGVGGKLLAVGGTDSYVYAFQGL